MPTGGAAADPWCQKWPSTALLVAPPPAVAGRGVGGRGAALLAAMRNKNRRPGEAGNQGQPAPTEASSDTTQSPLDVQSTAVGRGALLIWALYSRMSSATSVTSNTAQLLSVDKHSWNV